MCLQTFKYIYLESVKEMCVHKSENRILAVKEVDLLSDLKAPFLPVFEALCYNFHQRWNISDDFY